jgi:CheY-like chemotaxis protein
MMQSNTGGLAVVADDDDDARELVAGRARMLGLRVVEACDGAHLLSCVRALWRDDENVTLVISDIGMRECDGIEATYQLLLSHPALPILLMTAFGDQLTVRRAKESGARDVLRKPFSLALLEKLILEHADRPRPSQ